MSNNFYCEICNISFSSWKELKEHWMSVEHREKARDVLLRSEQLLDMMKKMLKLGSKPEERIRNE